MMDARSSQRFDAVDDFFKTEQSQKPRSVWSGLYALLAVLLLVFSLVFYFSAGFGMRDVAPKSGLSDYNAVETRGIATYINQAETLDQCTQTVLKYHVLDDTAFYALGQSQGLPALKETLIRYMCENAPEGMSVVSVIEPRGR